MGLKAHEAGAWIESLSQGSIGTGDGQRLVHCEVENAQIVLFWVDKKFGRAPVPIFADAS